MLSVDNVSFSYGEVPVLHEIGMTMNDGQITCVMGRNGVGKTTLMKIIMGIFRVQTGEIWLDSQQLTPLTANQRARHGMAIVPQGRQIFPRLTVYENLLVGLAARKRGFRIIPGSTFGESLKAAVATVLGPRTTIPEEIYDLFPVLKSIGQRMGGDLSGGQQQQLAIARALVSKPQVLLLDEPTEGIQPNIIQEIGAVLDLLTKQGMTVVLVEQYLDFVKEFGQQFYIMDRGRVVSDGETVELTSEIVHSHLSV